MTGDGPFPLSSPILWGSLGVRFSVPSLFTWAKLSEVMSAAFKVSLSFSLSLAPGFMVRRILPSSFSKVLPPLHVTSNLTDLFAPFFSLLFFGSLSCVTCPSGKGIMFGYF